jgi:AraC-like DNA-binding protein
VVLTLKFVRRFNMCEKSTNSSKEFASPSEQLSLNPVSAVLREYSDGILVNLHSHAQAQLVYAATGVMELATEDGYWIVPPQRAVWMPAGVYHQMRARGLVSLHALYIRPASCPPEFTIEPRIFSVTPLLRELIARVGSLPSQHVSDGREARLVSVLIDEITYANEEPILKMKLSIDRRLRRVCEGILQNPADNRTLDDWAIEIGASSRTLARLFTAELGVSFRHWRQQARLVCSFPRLSAGEAISAIATDFGYDTPGAFSEMF